MSFYERYDKSVMEEFALNSISNSFNVKYSSYFSPQNTDNFDFVSPDEKSALEITTVIPKNEIDAYIYEKQKSLGKMNLSINKIAGAELRDDGTLRFYYGGSMQEIRTGIRKAIEKKQKIAIKRSREKAIDVIDLCICIQDGSMFDIYSFEQSFPDLEEYVFENIFFVTPSYFIRYNKYCGFEQYLRR